MGAQWLDRPPTTEEVRLHAEAHPRFWHGADRGGLWLFISADEDDIKSPRIVSLGPVPHDCRYGRWLPLTAEGLPAPQSAPAVDGWERGRREDARDVPNMAKRRARATMTSVEERAELLAEFRSQVASERWTLPYGQHALVPKADGHLAVLHAAFLEEVADAMEAQQCEALELDQLRVQLAGCGVAALGGTAPEQVARPGDYGWSASYGDVLTLRARFERLLNTHPNRDALLEEWGLPEAPTDAPPHQESCLDCGRLRADHESPLSARDCLGFLTPEDVQAPPSAYQAQHHHDCTATIAHAPGEHSRGEGGL